MYKAKSTSFEKIMNLILVGVVIVLALYIGIRMASGKEEAAGTGRGRAATESASNVLNVSVQKLEKATFTEYTTAGGEILSSENDYSVTSEVGGKITQILIKENDYVNEGDIVAYVDPSVAGATYKVQPVKAIKNGYVSSVDAVVGQNITTTTSIASVGQTGDLEISVKLPERHLSTIKEGMRATFTTAAWPDEKLDATVKSIGTQIDSANRTFTVKLSIEQDERLKAGMYVSVALETNRIEDCIILPTTAVKTYLQDECVYVYNESAGRAERRIVTTGDRTGGNAVITSGLEEGESVIVRGTVTDGTLVNPVD